MIPMQIQETELAGEYKILLASDGRVKMYFCLEIFEGGEDQVFYQVGDVVFVTLLDAVDCFNHKAAST